MIREKKGEKFFFLRFLSSLFFRSDWIPTEKRKDFICYDRLQPLIRAEKKEKKRAQKKFLRSLAAFLYRRRRRRRKKSSQDTHI